jgi:hypothetical protein
MTLNEAGECIVFECPRCLHHIWLPSETLDRLRTYLSDPTIGYQKLDVLCSRCQRVCTASATLIPRTLRGLELETLRLRKVGQWPMKCATEDCTARRIVIAIGKENTTEAEQRAEVAGATIADGFLCPKGHQIVGI